VAFIAYPNACSFDTSLTCLLLFCSPLPISSGVCALPQYPFLSNMKILKALCGADMLLVGAGAVSSAGRYLKGRSVDKSSSIRQLENENVFSSCAIPCSIGTCAYSVDDWEDDDADNPWEFGTTQKFQFKLKEGQEYAIAINRDLDQCAMPPEAELYDVQGRVLKANPGNMEPQIPGSYYEVDRHDECGPDPPAYDPYIRGDPRLVLTPEETGVFTLQVNIMVPTKPCPKGGFKFSVIIEPPAEPEYSFIDPSCTAPEYEG